MFDYCDHEAVGPHRLLLLGPRSVVLEPLGRLLEETRLFEVEMATTVEWAIARAAAHRPAAVLVDQSLPDGIPAVAARVHAAVPGVPVMVLADDLGRSAVEAAIDAGVVGYVSKDVDGDRLASAVEDVIHAGASFDPTAAAVLVRREREPVAVDEISAREREALVLVASGMANKQIAREMGIADRTVKAHLSRVFQRIGATNRTQAALWARRAGLVEETSLQAS